MARMATLFYGIVSYLLFFASFVYLTGFLGNFGVPKSIDSGPPGSSAAALAGNLALLLLFGVQHSVMARPAFKRWWTRFVPEAAERSTYVMATNVCLWLLYAFWQPLPTTIWHVEAPIAQTGAWVLFGAGWLIILLATLMIDHFDLFGLRQVWLHFRGRPYTALPFATPGFYAHLRHPLYLGWGLAFWATPHMTVGHLLLALVWGGYMRLAIRFEERDLVAHFGEVYRRYRKTTPMLIPNPFAVRSAR